MKKVLALVLTAAMLLSCVAMGVSAKRVWEVETTVDGTWYAVGENWNPGTVSDAANFKTEIRLMGNSEYSGPALTSTMGFPAYIDIANDKVGFADVWVAGRNHSISYDFNVDTWYDVVYETVDGVTTITINGDYVGEIDAEDTMGAAVGHTFYGVFVSDYKITDLDDGSVDFHEDFEDETITNGAPTGGQIVTFEETNVVSNNNVMVAKDGTWYAVGENWNPGTVSDAANFKTEIRLMGNSEYSGPALTSTMGFPAYIDIANDKVGFADVWVAGRNHSISYDFNADTWYDVVYETVDGVTTITINGEYVGEIDAEDTMGAAVGHTFYGVYVSDYKITDLDDGSVDFYEDFSDDTITNGAPTGGQIVTFDVEGAKYDLGNWYWCFPEGNSYNPVDVGSLGDNFDVEMDICIDVEGGGLKTGWSNLAWSPVVTNDTVGVYDSTIAYEFENGEWYHIKWDADNGSTTIYVDDVYVGTVDKAATLYDGTQAFWQWDKISIDNFSVGSFYADMEDGNLNDGQGVRLEYDYGIVEKDPLKDVPKYEVGGDAILFESNSNSTYLEFSDVAIPVNGWVSFDLAIIPNDKASGENVDSYFEIWRDGGPQRFIVGTEYAGRDTDTYTYDALGLEWGEGTANNFHQVTMKFDNMKAWIYVDGVQAWTGSAAAPFASNILMMAWNCSAIIDNFVVYDIDMNVICDDINAKYNYGALNKKIVDVDAENFCEANGHVYGSTAKTISESCTQDGEWTYYCGVCTEAYDTSVIPQLAHRYENYNINNVTDGYIVTDCRDCGGARKYVKAPAEGSYTGEMYAYFDMTDDLFGEYVNSSDRTSSINSNWFGDQFYYENGKAIVDASSFLANYTEFKMDENGLTKIDPTDWSINYRMTWLGTWENIDDGGENWNGYDYLASWWINGVKTEIGYNHTLGEFYVTGANGNVFPKVSTPYTLEVGKTYDIKIAGKAALEYDEEDPSFYWPTEDTGLYIYVNGEEVVNYSVGWYGESAYFTAMWDIATTDAVDRIYTWNFGTSYAMDDFVLGSFDFAWAEVVGDVDNDGALTSADALMMRKYLAKVIDDSAVFVDLMDVNADGAINAKDQLAIRKALVA